MKKFRWQIRRNKQDKRGRYSFGMGARVGFWPCLGGPYIQIEFMIWNLSVWIGTESYK